MPFTDNRTAKPCKYGHVAGRKAQGQCRECHRLREKERYRADPAKVLNARTGRPVPPSRTREGRRDWVEKNPEKQMLHSARVNAKRGGFPCTITVADLAIPELCPLLGIRLERHAGVRTDASPSLDKIRPELGYVRGNVWVISWRANRLKNNATLQELQTLVANLSRKVLA